MALSQTFHNLTFESGLSQMIDAGHTNKQYDHKLRALKDAILLMGYQAEQMIADSMRALKEQRLDIAQEVILRDDTLDRIEIDVDRMCREILAIEHPVAGDLRFVITSFKIVRDIERIGDIAVNIARRAIELLKQSRVQSIIGLPLMADVAQKTLGYSLDALVTSDDKLAEKVIDDDRDIDDLSNQI